jgi:hypothetical protein
MKQIIANIITEELKFISKTEFDLASLRDWTLNTEHKDIDTLCDTLCATMYTIILDLNEQERKLSYLENIITEETND